LCPAVHRKRRPMRASETTVALPADRAETAERAALADQGIGVLTEDVVARHLARAEEDLVAATGGASLCSVGNGTQVGPVKYSEGRYAALRELRHLRRSPDPVAVADVVGLLATWRTARDRAESQGPAWAAYRDGGVAALQGLVDELTTGCALR
jgi:hypothetical protein